MSHLNTEEELQNANSLLREVAIQKSPSVELLFKIQEHLDSQRDPDATSEEWRAIRRAMSIPVF